MWHREAVTTLKNKNIHPTPGRWQLPSTQQLNPCDLPSLIDIRVFKQYTSLSPVVADPLLRRHWS